jgi:hypothetical protein
MAVASPGFVGSNPTGLVGGTSPPLIYSLVFPDSGTTCNAIHFSKNTAELRLRFFIGTGFAEGKTLKDLSQPQALASKVREIMGKRRNPAYCKHFPLCEHLKTLVSELSPKSFDTLTIVLAKEAEAVCSQCEHFEPKEKPENT